MLMPPIADGIVHASRMVGISQNPSRRTVSVSTSFGSTTVSGKEKEGVMKMARNHKRPGLLKSIAIVREDSPARCETCCRMTSGGVRREAWPRPNRVHVP